MLESCFNGFGDIITANELARTRTGDAFIMLGIGVTNEHYPVVLGIEPVSVVAEGYVKDC